MFTHYPISLIDMGEEKFTAVEWLSQVFEDIHMPNWIYDTIKDAEDMEIEQSENYARFVIECDRQKLPILKFKDWVKL